VVKKKEKEGEGKMKVKMQYAVDWATRKDIKICNVKTGKVESLPNQIDAWRKWFKKLNKRGSAKEILSTDLVLSPCEFYLEEGGGDSFKLLARKLKHKIFTIPGVEVKRERNRMGLEKDDETDALILRSMIGNGFSFRAFTESDEVTAKIYLIYKGLEKTEANLVQEKNRLFALTNQIELLSLDGFEKKLIDRQTELVKSLQNKFKTEFNLLKKIIHSTKEWTEFFEPIKGCGERTAGGIMGSIKNIGRFPHKFNLRSYGGMKKKKGNQNFCHSLKRALYFFAKGVIRQKNEEWYSLYLDMKRYYKNKHKEWTKAKLDNWATKFIETKFLDKYYNYSKNGK